MTASVSGNSRSNPPSTIHQTQSASSSNLSPKSLVRTIVDVGTYVQDGVKFIIRQLKPSVESLNSLVEMKEIGATVMTPFVVGGLVNKVSKFSVESAFETLEQSAEIVDDVKEIGENVATVATTLGEAKLVRASKLKWLKPFACVMTGLAIASIISSVLETIKMIRLYKEMKSELNTWAVKGDLSENGYDELIKMLEKKHAEDKSFIKDSFNVKAPQFWKGLHNAQEIMNQKLSSLSEVDKAEGTAMRKKAVSNLLGRVKHNIISAIVSAVSSTVCAIGAAILLATPLMPVGVVMSAGSVVLDVGKWVHHKVTDYTFVRRAEIKRTKLEWVLA